MGNGQRFALMKMRDTESCTVLFPQCGAKALQFSKSEFFFGAAEGFVENQERLARGFGEFLGTFLFVFQSPAPLKAFILGEVG